MTKFNPTDYRFLLLDRDGVINEERPGDYVKYKEELIFTPNALDALQILTNEFEKTFVVTNQRGIGRGKMSVQALTDVHNYMLNEISKASGKIDAIYYSPDISDHSINRKPNIGMAFQIQDDNSDFDFDRTIMVGNSKSDIIFGKKLGMYTILVGNKYSKEDSIYQIADAYFGSLYQFAEFYKKEKSI